MDFTPDVINAMYTTVSGNKARFTIREVKKAEHARKIMEQLGYPSESDMKSIILQGGIVNIPVTTSDVARAEVIFGRDLAVIKGKSTRGRPTAEPQLNRVRKAEVKILHMYTDIFHIRKRSFLLSVLKPINLLMVHALKDRYKSSDVDKIIRVQIDTANARGFEVENIMVDPDPVFIGSNLGSVISYAAAGSHVPIAERAIRTIKERCRAIASVMPYKISRRMIADIVLGVTSLINLIPSKGDNDYRSGFERFTGIKPDFRWFGDLSFGDYVQIPNRVTDAAYNTDVPRTIGAVAMRHLANGVWRFYCLSTNNFVSRKSWTRLPRPDIVIEKLTDIYLNDEKISMTTSQASNDDRLPPAILVDPSPPIVETDSDDEHSEEDMIPGPGRTVTITDDIDDNLSEQNDASHLHGENIEEIDAEEINENEPYESRYGTKWIEGNRMSSRNRRPPSKYALHVSLKTELEKYGDKGVDAVKEELSQMIDKKVWSYIDYYSLSKQQKKDVIRSMIFLKEKYDSTGAFEKLKARLVAGGHMQHEMTNEDTSSPTVPTEIVFTVLAIAASECRHIRTVDIGGAYLECDMNVDVFMSLNPTLSKLICEIDNAADKYISTRGMLTVKLEKALYGCKQSGLLWYMKLKQSLEEIGLVQNPYERCLFNDPNSESQ